MKFRQQFLLLLATLALPAIGSAQTRSAAPVTLNWQRTEKVQPKAGLPDNISVFDGAMVAHKERLPYYQLQFRGETVTSFTLENTIYEALTEAESKGFPASYNAGTPEIEISTGIENKLPASLVRFVPLRRNPQSGRLEKLVSFTYSYNARPGRAPRQANHLRTYTNNSVLSSGDWYRMAVTGTGMHKIDRNTLQQMGLDASKINPDNIRVYGNGGAMLPEANSAPRADDLTENAVMQVNRPDGTLDYLLFYAQGPHTWSYDMTEDRFKHSFNIYSDTAYYFLTVTNSPGRRISTEQASGAHAKIITSYDERWFYEKDLRNVIKSGKEWYGEDFTSYNPSRDFTFPITGLEPNSVVKVTSAVMGSSPNPSSFTVKLNSLRLGQQSIKGYDANYAYHDFGYNAYNTYVVNTANIPNSANGLTVNLTYSGNGSSAQGFLNYLEINALRRLRLYGNQTSFQSLQSVGNGAASLFRIEGAPASAIVWDITNPLRPIRQTVSFSGNFAEFTAKTDSLREFVVFNGSDFSTPAFKGRVANQNLHALNRTGTLDFVIVTHPEFVAEANRLANHRRQHDNMEVAVVTTNQIYNEFSSGAQDLTAMRDFMKMLYDRSNKSGDDVMYLLLLGDGSYDYKNRTPNNTNYVPIYESVNSLQPIDSHSSDDFIGFLDDMEGSWGINDDHFLDIGIGRLPAQSQNLPTVSENQAAAMVNKIIGYDSPDKFGKWRNRITFVSDDSDSNFYLNDNEDFAEIVEKKYISYNTNKVYLDLFRQESVPSGQRAPTVNNQIDKAIVDQGSLIVNYVGHGGESGWTEEQILHVPQILNWNNSQKPSFLVTATCAFGRYDDPARPSGAEYALYNERNSQGGAVGLITTTRPVYQHSNKKLNIAFFNAAFEPVTKRGSQQMPRLGDIMRTTKNNSVDRVNNRNFALLGDPSMRLAYPEFQAQIDEINQKTVSSAPDTLKALSKVKLTGSVRDANNNILSSFNGQVHVTVFEKESTINTLGDENGKVQPVQVRQNIIYDGLATVASGAFSVSFIVPKDIAYNYGFGKISLYANSSSHDAHGATKNIIIGGSDNSVATDNDPPQINLFMDDESFVFGGLTGSSTTLLAKLFDDNGINTVGMGIGHEITAVLDDNKEKVHVLNDYYTAEKDNYQRGTVRFPFKDLATGPHSLRIKAWDTHNNSNEAYLEFIVANSEDLALDNVLNYPNPVVGSEVTTFHFDHNRPGEDLEVQVQIFTISGKLIKTLETTSYASRAHVGNLTWDCRDDYHDKLGKGVYVYRISVRSQRDGSKVSKYEKLVLLK